MPVIIIKQLEEDDEIKFPVTPGKDLSMADLRSAFPNAVSLRYQENDEFYHVLCREGLFVEPDGGWLVSNRKYIVKCVLGASQATENSRFENFLTYRNRIIQNNRPKIPTQPTHNSGKEKTEEDVNIFVGIGQFKNGTFKKMTASNSSFGGKVVVGPFHKNDNTTNQIKEAAFEKFSAVDQTFKKKYKSSSRFELVYPDGTIVNNLPDNSQQFSIIGYRNFLDPRMRIDRIRLFLCEKSHWDTTVISDCSSGEKLPSLEYTRPVSHTATASSSATEITPEPLDDHNTTLPVGALANPVMTTGLTERDEVKAISAIYDDSTYEDTVATIVYKTLREVGDKEEPTSIIKEYAKFFLVGRQLDLTTDSGEDDMTGRTAEIHVGRYTFFDDAVSELQTVTNIRYPLEVSFYGEVCEDFGGPRKEFFTLLLKDITTNLTKNGKLEHNTSHVVKKSYYASAIGIGLSLLQGGPCYRQLSTIITSLDDSEHCIQFKDSLKRTGLYQLIAQKPTLNYVFQNPEKRLNIRMLIHLLKPNFSLTGSNRRAQEEQGYSMFMKYVRQVAAGRRPPVTLESILKFVTGMEEEPITGFSISPSISFAELPGDLPTASTCVYNITLPIKTNQSMEQQFNLFDLAFVNQYFGLK